MKKVFVSREFVKSPAELSKDEFIKMATEDIEVAKVEYMKWSNEVAEQRYKEDCEEYAKRREQKVHDIIDASYKKYKRESYRQRWVEQEIAKLSKILTRGYQHIGRDLTDIRWDLKPWSNGVYYIDTKRDLKYILGHLYDEAIKNKYFLQCTGWSIVEDFTTEFRFHLSEELQKEWKEDERKLSDDINRFYANTTYCGD